MRPLVVVVAVLAVVVGAWAGARGVRLFVRGLRSAEDPRASLWVIRGLRGIIVCVCLVSLALGAVLEQIWLLVFAGLWLLEEIYETGVLALILRADEPDGPGHSGSERPETGPSPRKGGTRAG
jgi:hypothetical protein